MREPRCIVCPLTGHCRARREGISAALPAKAAKAIRPTRHGIAYWAVAGDGSVLLRRRPEKGLLGGMMEVPTSEFRAAPWTLAEAEAAAPVPGSWRVLDGTVVHGFTHFALELTVLAARVGQRNPAIGTWSTVPGLKDHALPTLMKKVWRHAVSGTGAGTP